MAQDGTPNLAKKPYGFVQLPERFEVGTPIWHDGKDTAGLLSGEVRCELTAITPLLVGWERQRVDDGEAPWPVEWEERGEGWVGVSLPEEGWGQTIAAKSLLCPLRAPWGERPVLLPGDSLKGLLRHELGALLGAPMERVAERSYSYRPNSMFAARATLVARIARVPREGVELQALPGGRGKARVPTVLELLPDNLQYDRTGRPGAPGYRFDAPRGAPYRGGMGAGEKLNSRKRLHKTLEAVPDRPAERWPVPQAAQRGYLKTVEHLLDAGHGHFSERHPDIPKEIKGDEARSRIQEVAESIAFQPGDLVWIEWDKERRCIVSLGWHYYYRWAYTDTVRRQKGAERPGLFPLPEERDADEAGAPAALSAVRRLFGYTGDSEGSQGIGTGDHTQLMGRLSLNAAVEVIEAGERFLPPTFLKELGLPRPSAVEFYLEQPHHPGHRPGDQANLATYGDAEGYDEPGRLAGRKFYLDRRDAACADDSERGNERSTLALQASKPGRRFRFTLRFRDLEPGELAAVLVALAPDQLRDVVGGRHPDGYCSKLGYARPLGWGSVRIEVKAVGLLELDGATPALEKVADVEAWVRGHFKAPPALRSWLEVHRQRHPDAHDYPRAGPKNEIFSFHANERSNHAKQRRYRVRGRK